MRYTRNATKRPTNTVELTPEAYGAMHAESRRTRTTLRQTASRLILESLERPAPKVEIAEPAKKIPTEPTIWQRICRACKEF